MPLTNPPERMPTCCCTPDPTVSTSQALRFQVPGLGNWFQGALQGCPLGQQGRVEPDPRRLVSSARASLTR